MQFRLPAFTRWLDATPLVGCLCVLVVSTSRAAAEDGLVLIQAKQVYTMTGEVLRPGSVLISAGKISLVASQIEPTDAMRLLEVDTLMPGLVDAYSRAGLAGGTSELSREITPELNTLRSIDWRSRQFREVVSEGTTCVNVVPGTDNVVAGFSCVVKTAGSVDKRVLDPRTGLVVSVCSDPVSRNRSRSRPDSIFVRQPTNRMGVVWVLRSRLKLAGGDPDPGLTKRDAQVHRILRGVQEGRHRVFGVSRADFDIRSLMNIGAEFGYEPVVLGGDEAYRMTAELAARGTPVVYTALTTPGDLGPEGTELRWNVPGKLHDAGVTFCLAGGRLLEQAQFAARYGLDRTVALQAVTSIPAKLLKVDGRVGSIASGLDADLLALNGGPFEFTSAVEWVMIDGKVVAK